MATYNRLSVSAGGGIISDMKKSDKEQDATLCIGLGGTGKDALKLLKKEVYNRLKPDDPNASIPVYRNIKFLLIDSDDDKLDVTHDIFSIDKSTEYFDISNTEIVKTFRSKDILKARQELSWLNYKNIPIKTAEHGAGGIRQVGRFLLIDKANLLKARFTALIQDVVQGVTGDLNVHIFSGISGGTGSGTFIDVCYIVRHVLETMGRESTQISGYFFLPDVNLSVKAVMESPLISTYVKYNGYAALKELDYLMGLEEAHGRFIQNYGGFNVNTCRSPVDMCYLISVTNTAGVVLEDGYKYGISVAVDYVISFLSKVTLPDGLQPNDAGSMTLKGHIANLAQAKNNIEKIHGASFAYNIIGAANAEMPLSDIITYLGSKLFEQFEKIVKPIPTEKDIIDFVETNQITFEQLLQKLTKGVIDKVPYPPILLQSTDISPGDKRVINCADDWTANTRGTIEENRKSMIEALKNYDVPENSTSIISRIFSNLYLNYAMDFKTGPFFAMRLLNGQNNKNLIHILDGYIEKNEELLSAEIRQESLRRQELETAELALNKSKFLDFITKKKRVREYLEAMNHWYIHLANIDKFNYMKSFLKELRAQVIKLSNEFFSILTIVMDTLKNTFSENNRHLADESLPKNAYTWQILEIKDIKEELDKEVLNLDVDQEFKKLVDMLFKQWKDWVSPNENKISKLISGYIINEFQTIVNKEMTDYLMIKYETAISEQLINKIENEIIQGQLNKKSTPLFWNNGLFKLANIAKYSIISVPFNATEIIQAAENVMAQGGTVRRTGLTDRIFMMRFYSGIPLYAYQGLTELERVYENSIATAGLHLYEAGDVNWKEYLPSPYPDSFKMDGHTIPRIIERNKNLKAELDSAKKVGIVYFDTISWYIKRSKTEDVSSLLAAAGSYKENDKINLLKLENVLNYLKDIKEQMHMEENIERIPISTEGATQASTERVLYDNYLRFPEIEKIVRKELDKINAIDEIIKKLEKEAKEEKQKQGNKEAFFNAVFTGIIKLERSKTTFAYEQFGMEQVLALQDSSMPYGTKAPLYQAFLTYKNLDNEMTDLIQEKTSEAINNINDEIYAVAEAIQARYNSDFMKLILSKVATDVKQKDIQLFYNDFMKALQEYIIIYR